MKLYYSKGACSLAVRIIINELDLRSEYEQVDLKTKRTETNKDFLEINPKGSVPTLETNDGEILTENAVILQYLADTANATKLLPKVGDFNRYRVLEWVNFIATELHKNCGPLFNPTIDQKIKDQLFIPLLKSKLTFVDKRLLNKFLLDNEFSIADAYLFIILAWTVNFKLNLQDWPHLNLYFKELQKRESIQKSLQDEGLMKLATQS